MLTKKILTTIVIILGVVFLGLQLMMYETEASGVRALAVIMLTALYCSVVKNKRMYFFMFLIVFSLAEVLNVLSEFGVVLEGQTDYFYYIVNGLYILSYMFLIVRVLRDLNWKVVISKLPIQIVLLLIMDVFFVSIVTGTTKAQLTSHEYLLEFSYNAVIMLLLSLSLINYMCRDDKKSMNFLLGSIFIVLSEVIQLAYFYVSEMNVLNVICSFFLVLAFLFFYIQSRLEHSISLYSIGEDIKV